MNQGLELSLTPERLDEGTPEEKATFGQLIVRADEFVLTEGFDAYLEGYRPGPYVAGYYRAEWLAWNWWRLRWEPRRRSPEWLLAHLMNGIGNGYQWPNLTIYSNGARTVLASRRSSPTAEPFRYAGAPTLVLPARDYEAAVDAFMIHMLERVRPLGETNLSRLWNDVTVERADPEIAKRRRLQALLGRDTDDDDEGAIEAFVEDSSRLGAAAVEEVAAEAGVDATLIDLHAPDYQELAARLGYEGRPADAAQLRTQVDLRPEDVEAWKVGAAFARALRKQETLGEAALSDLLLAQLAGVSRNSLSTKGKEGAPFSFALDCDRARWRAAFRNARKTGRRFDLARMIGDRFLAEAADRLHPATDAATWRQQAQRSFAVELLAPIEAVGERLSGDLSLERQHDIADEFIVSPMSINSLLKNHGLLPRDDPFEDVPRAA